MNTRTFILAGLALIAVGCRTERNAANVKIEQAYALGINSAMGGMVEPDRFQIYVSAFEDGHHVVKKGDTFRAAVYVGVAGNLSKYGSMSGVKFTITGDGVQGTAGSDSWTVYPAVSDGLTIFCDAQNRLQFSMYGASADDIEIHVRTAASPTNWLVWQNGHPGLSYLGLSGPGVGRMQRYNCLTERQP